VDEFVSPIGLFDPFDVAWARGMLRKVIVQLQRYCTERGQTAVWTVFEARLLRPILQHAEPLSYEALAVQCHLDSPKAAANALITAKRVFRKLFEEAIAVYAPEDGEQQEELHLIRSVFASGVTLDESLPADPHLDESCLFAQMLDLPRGQHVWSPLELEAILDQQLALPATDFGLPQVVLAASSPTLLDVLTILPSTSTAFIQIKHWAKSQATSPAPTIPREVAKVLYFAALSAARISGHTRITHLPNRVLAVSLMDLVEQGWIPAPLQKLFQTCSHGLAATAP